MFAGTTNVQGEYHQMEIFTARDIDRIPRLQQLSDAERVDLKAVAAVLPFRVNQYVLEELIDWSNIPDDPIYQLTFPQPGMLEDEALARMRKLIRTNAPKSEIEAEAHQIQLGLNPHPAGQRELNVPNLHGEPLPGMQHKYRETVLFFPAQGQTCHTYCTYCFRWAQFVGISELKFASRQAETLREYLEGHPEVSSVLFTGGDPMVMNTRLLRSYIEPLLGPGLEHIISIRIGTKSPAYWPFRYLHGEEADDLMRLFEEVRASGKSLALMSHYTHPRELSTPSAQAALRRIQNAGAVVRCQSPVIRHVNDDAQTWADLWRAQVQLGAVPYYMFVERDTGAKRYFELPLARALEIYQSAYAVLSGLGRTVRGPSMSATPGKVLIDGVAEVAGEKVFVLKFLQARDPDWLGRVFFARFDESATWLDQLVPAFGEKEFFFTRHLEEMKAKQRQPAWGDEIERNVLSGFGGVEWE